MNDYLEERAWNAKVNELVRKGWAQDRAEAHVAKLRETRESVTPFAPNSLGKAGMIVELTRMFEHFTKRFPRRKSDENKKGST